MSGNAHAGNYRAVATLPGFRTWLAATATARLSDAGTPLALLLLGHAAAGSFAVGGVMSGAYALGEAVAAPWLGARPHGRRALATALLLRAALFLALAATPPAALLTTAAAGAGVVAAGTPGSLRALLTRIADGPLLHRALSLDTVLLELAWAAAPALLALLATADPRLAVIALAAATTTSGLTCLRLVNPHPLVSERAGRPRIATLRPAAASLVLGLFGGLTGGVLDTAVPPRLAGIGSPAALAGLLFTGYSISSVLTGLAYGTRRWPGSPHRQAEMLLAAELVILLPAALVPSLPVIAAAVTGAGACAAPLLTARSLAIRADLPDEALPAGFSSLYAVNGAGYGLAGLAVGALLPGGAAFAFGLPLVVLLAATAVVATFGGRRHTEQITSGVAAEINSEQHE